MLLTSTEYLYVPVTAPAGVDITGLPVSVALRLESAGGEPALGDYLAGTVVNASTDKTQGEVKILLTAGQYAAGQYLVFARLQSTPEDVRKCVGRWRIGDVRV